MRLHSFLTRLAFLACFASTPAIGAEIGRHPNDSATLNAISFKGKIEDGDAAKFRSYYATLPKKRATAVYLDSGGGLLRDGLDLGYFFRSEGIRTVIEGNGGRCASACAFAFLGGFDKATQKPWRTKSSSSRLAFHAFYAALLKPNYTAAEVDAVVFNNTLAASALVTYFRDVDGDFALLSYSLRMRQNQVYEISNEQALEIGINVWDEASQKMRLAESSKAY